MASAAPAYRLPFVSSVLRGHDVSVFVPRYSKAHPPESLSPESRSLVVPQLTRIMIVSMFLTLAVISRARSDHGVSDNASGSAGALRS